MSRPVLEVRNLRKDFQVRGHDRRHEELVAVRDVTLSLEGGGSLAVVGESGSGKSTTARVIAGLETATAGTILVNGDDWSAPPRSTSARRQRSRVVQMVFQDPFGSLDPHQRIGDGIDELLRLHGSRHGSDRGGRAPAVERLLDQVGLDTRHARSKPGALSGGQRQRAAIARALALQPQILILDEAVSALDVSVQAQVLKLLAELREKLEISYVFVTHDLAVVRQVCDDCVVMRNGEVVEAGPVDAILGAPKQEYTKALIAAVPGPGWRPRRQLMDAARSSTATG
jgi:ABC-type glutathione transport system ATPase component